MYQQKYGPEIDYGKGQTIVLNYKSSQQPFLLFAFPLEKEKRIVWNKKVSEKIREELLDTQNPHKCKNQLCCWFLIKS